MRRLQTLLGSFAAVTGLCMSSFAATEHVLANNNNSLGNSVVWYDLNTKTGHLTKVSVLDTNGKGWGGEADLSGVQQAISLNAGCIFALDLLSSDIAAFSKATGYKRVGNYFDQNLVSNADGDSIALSPNGQFLYASYTGSDSIAVWRVNSDCSLALITRSGGITSLGPLEVTPSGRYLLARGGSGASEFAIDHASGTITYLGTVAFSSGPCSGGPACMPYGIQVAKDNKLVIFASFPADVRSTFPVMLTARITPRGLTDPKVRRLPVENDLRLNTFPLLSASGYTGNGPIYLGLTSGNGQYSPGVLTASFTEKPVKFAVTNSTVANPEVGNIAVTGNTMVVAQYPNQIAVFRIKKDGSLKLLSTTTIDEQGEGMFSLSIFPNTR
jgi:hypothetical protein